MKADILRDKFLTFRLPDYRVNTEFRLGRALMGIINAAGLAQEIGFHSPPIFEAILSMTQSAEEIIAIQEAFIELTNLKSNLYKTGVTTLVNRVELIRPPIMVNASGEKSSEPCIAKGINPPIAVKVVSIMGIKRIFPAVWIASSRSLHCALNWLA